MKGDSEMEIMFLVIALVIISTGADVHDDG